MQRRELLKIAIAFSAAGLPVPPLWAAAREDGGVKPLGESLPFDYAWLKGEARNRASHPYVAPPAKFMDALARLSWDQWQAMRFRPEHALWAHDDASCFRASFFHLGWLKTIPVQIYEVENGRAQQLAYDPAAFDYTGSGVDGKKLPKDLGYAGFQIKFHADWTRDIMAFQDHSYFRATDGDMQYGMSARGLAIDTGLDPEEFPIFERFWLEKPAKDSSRITLYALLDSPSVAGAYRFIVDVADTLVMDIDVALYPRKTIQRLGIAPLTSMFQCGENDHRRSDDWRPEIHDSDGLQLHTGNGEWLWRPLNNPAGIRFNSFFDENPRGFGLLQRDRLFDHYQDDGVFYEKRPSVWVEPKSGWGKGAVQLVELATNDETNDNIGAFWNPAEKPQAGEELLFGYKLYWCRKPPVTPPLATVHATRDGAGGIVGQKHTYYSRRFAVDFAGGDFGMLGGQVKVEPVITASRGIVEITSARPLYEVNGENLNGEPVHGWRAMFDIRPTDASIEPIDLRLFLKLDNQPLTETWIYQWTPPPVAERTF